MQILTSETLIIKFSDQDEYLRISVGNKKKWWGTNTKFIFALNIKYLWITNCAVYHCHDIDVETPEILRF